MRSHLHSLTAFELLTALKCAIYSMICRDSVVGDVSTMSTMKIVTWINSLKIKIIYSLKMYNLQYEVSRLCCGGCEYI